MSERVYNFAAGPAMLPIPVMEQIQKEFLDYKGMGVSIIEISHRTREFIALMEEANALFKELVSLPANYKILYVHGGAQMQFSAIPMNLMKRKPGKKAIYYETGNFSKIAAKEAERYGKVILAASSADTNFDRIPEVDLNQIDEDASYAYLTSNNTLFGTRWNKFDYNGEVKKTWVLLGLPWLLFVKIC